MSDEEIRAKVTVGPVSGEVAVKAPGLLATLMPKRALKAQLHQAVAAVVVDRMQSGESTGADIDLIEEIVGESAAKVVRRREIAARAEKALTAMPAVLQLPPMSDKASHAEAAKERGTSQDWLSRFWDDAGLVSDEELQNIYAHILATEARAPGSCSLRTIRVLRYMDRQTADAFAKLLPLVMNSEWMPAHVDIGKPFGQDVDYQLILELSDAGLIESHEVTWGPGADEDEVFLQYGTLVLRVQAWRQIPATRIHVYPLTRAGQELARVAQINRTPKVFFALARWLRDMAGLEDANLTCADMPPDGKVESVKEWKPLPEDAKSDDAKPKPAATS